VLLRSDKWAHRRPPTPIPDFRECLGPGHPEVSILKGELLRVRESPGGCLTFLGCLSWFLHFHSRPLLSVLCIALEIFWKHNSFRVFGSPFSLHWGQCSDSMEVDNLCSDTSTLASLCLTHSLEPLFLSGASFELALVLSLAQSPTRCPMSA
jgi:hypothetical protein